MSSKILLEIHLGGKLMELDMTTRAKIINRYRKPYQRASKKEKSKILDNIQESTGMHRDHIARELRKPFRLPKNKKKIFNKDPRGRKPKYGLDHKNILEKVWALLGFCSSRRMQAGMYDILNSLIKFGHLEISQNLYKDMCTMSASTMDRMLQNDRKVLNFGLPTTKPGSLLKSQIPIRRGTDWDDSVVGFMEADLVAHCGSNTSGEYVNTLNITDVSSGWTEQFAVKNKARVHIIEGLDAIRERLPFEMKGFDSDNGGEFINHHMLHYCKIHNLVFTRSRANTSNDSCYVEQKNWSIVRRAIGYDRYEGQEVVDLMNEFYRLLSLHNNFFMTSQKLVEKERDGAKVKKKHDKPLTPYRRLLNDPNVQDCQKEQMSVIFEQLDIMDLTQRMMVLQDKIKSLSKGW